MDVDSDDDASRAPSYIIELFIITSDDGVGVDGVSSSSLSDDDAFWLLYSNTSNKTVQIRTNRIALGKTQHSSLREMSNTYYDTSH